MMSCPFQIIDSIIEESQKGSAVEEAQLKEERNADTRAESEVKDENVAPVEREHPAMEPQPVVERSEHPQEQQEACSMALPDIPSLSSGSQEHVQPPDITSTLGKLDLPLDLPDLPRVSAEDRDREQRPADILDQDPLTDKPAGSSDPGPTKPPRQFTVEPDIVASTKKPPPSRPPPPSGAAPPRPPPPSRPALPLSKKSQECMRPAGLEGK